MKLLTVAIPCYNSADYMRRSIESALAGGDRVEILIIDDGSAKDDTLSIAREYETRYPGICRAIHQENGGHGEAVNTGLKNASGLYFKVLDSDDRLDKASFKKVLDKLEEYTGEDGAKEPLDLFICNFIYDKVGQRHKRVMSYRTALPVGKVFGWKDVKYFLLGQYILMHSVIYRRDLLISCGLELPKHTFYVDNIYVYYPLPHAERMYYMDINLYRYFIGREDQSVHENVMIGRIDQQIRVTKLMLSYYDLETIEPKKLRRYMFNYLQIMMTISSILAIRSKDPENMKKRDELWASLKASDPRLYKKLKATGLGFFMTRKTKLGNRLAEGGYKAAQKIYGFN